MKCKYKVKDRDDGSCNKKAVSKYKIDGESEYCRLHHYMVLSYNYANKIVELQEEIDDLNSKPQTLKKLEATYVYNILDRPTVEPITLERFTGVKETWHFSGNAPPNQLMLVSVAGATISELETGPQGVWYFDLHDWHIPASCTDSQIRLLFPGLNTEEGDTFVIPFKVNQIGTVKKDNHKCKPMRIRSHGNIQSVICEQCGKWLKDVQPPGGDPQF